MSGNVTVNRFLSNLGLSATQPRLSGGAADKKSGEIRKLATQIGVEPQVAHALVTGDVNRLATASTDALKQLSGYLQAAGDKTAAQGRGSEHVIEGFRQTTLRASQLKAAELNRLRGNFGSLPFRQHLDGARRDLDRAEKYAKLRPHEALRRDGEGVTPRGTHLAKANAQVKQAAALAKTPEEIAQVEKLRQDILRHAKSAPKSQGASS